MTATDPLAATIGEARLYMRMHLDDHPDTTAQLIRRTAWYATTAWEVAP